MILEDFHTHTSFCDGKNTPEEMVRAAIGMSMTRLGFSGHSHVAFDEENCMSVAGTCAYRDAVADLKTRYRGKIEILCGIEQDYYSDAPLDGYDYAIGSVHYVKKDNAYIPVDESADSFKAAVQRHYGGDFYLFARDYFETAAKVAKPGISIIGHFDLIAKFNRGNMFFDENDSRYLEAAFAAADILLKSGLPFEINTGAISRGYRDTPYPSMTIYKYIKSRGGSFLLSSDAHSAATLCYRFKEYEYLL